MQFVTSDLHLDHFRAIEFNNRPFSSLAEMQSKIIAEINSLPDNAVLYILGDTFVKDSQSAAKGVLSQIKPTIKLVFCLGNHDHRLEKVFALYGEVHRILEVKHFKRKIVMGHMPMHEWNQGQYGSLHFYGHCHGRWQAPGKCTDVGWDVKQRILSLDEAIEMADQWPIFQPCHDINNGKLKHEGTDA